METLALIGQVLVFICLMPLWIFMAAYHEFLHVADIDHSNCWVLRAARTDSKGEAKEGE